MTTDLDDICQRCGCHEQAIHHPLCSWPSGEPTELNDGEVRASLVRIRRAQFKVVGGSEPGSRAAGLFE